MRKASWFSIVSWMCAALAAAVVLVSPAGAAPATPGGLTPGDGVVVDSLPAFGWDPVAGADRYEWEIAADPGFNSPVLGSTWDHFFTRNTRATMLKVIPNGTYWWHVRGVGVDGSVSPWSPARSFVKSWAAAPTLVAPANGETVVYPRDHFKLVWNPVPGAAKYLVSVATDPSLGSVVWSNGPIETQASAFTLTSPLPPDQTYYWGITPIDGSGNRGAPSAVRSFRWEWPSTTTPVVTDVAPEPEIYDYEFSWDPVPGAAGYELEVNSSVDFAPGSRVQTIPVNFITGLTTIGTTYSPKIALPNNRYYWRVRAVDPGKNAGVWNEGQPFTKSFDNALPSVENLRLPDNPVPASWPVSTHTPLITWNAVPGASSYEVEVTVHVDDGCQWTSTFEHWKSRTSTTAWTPLGWGWNNVKPYESPLTVGWDVPALQPGHAYCVRVTALDRPSDITSPYVRSAETYLPDQNTPAFEWLGPDPGAPCTSPCAAGALGAGDYLAPIGGVVRRDMPFLRWRPIEGYESYFVLVSKDQDFTNLVDYAFTRVPAYAPRLGFGPRTYPDETTQYYWAVLPARGGNGSGVTTAPRFSAPQEFHKQSLPPTLVSPDAGTVFPGPVRFHWTAATGARRYRLQVSTDPSFSSGIRENVITDSTVFTSDVSYPADTNLYWRVRADAESVEASDGVGLTWSATGTFRKTLAAPVPDPGNPTSGDAIPTWEWNTVAGAVSYDFHLEQPDGFARDFFRIPSAAATPTLMKGTGVWHWQIRANFPRVDTTVVTPGPWSARQAFTRSIREPGNPTEIATPTQLLLQWDPKMGARNYRVQISTRPDFGLIVENATTDNTRFASLLAQPAYMTGGTFYWRVAAADDIIANVGDYTAARSFTLPARGTTPPTTRTATTLTGKVTKTRTRIKVNGALSPSLPGKTIAVTLYRKRSGVYRAIATKRPVLTSLSRYATSFARPRPGYCRVTARFAGDTTHKASAKTVNFRC